MGQSGRIPVRRRLDELQRPVRWRLEVERRHQPARVLFQRDEAGMSVGTVEFATRRQDGRNNPRPILHIREPAKGSPCRKDEIERARCYMRSLIHSPLNEVGLQPGLVGKAPSKVQRRAGEIEPGNHGTASHQAERVASNVALQVEDALSGNVAEFGRFDRMEGVSPARKRARL